jgi:Predicted metal-dependent protease of the PAD1/JAB1 superfamily
VADDKTTEIEIMEEQDTHAMVTPLPQKFVAVGQIEADDVKVFIKRDVYDKIEKFSTSDTTRELGSILMGHFCEKEGQTHVVISDFIEAKYTESTAYTLTFTHESWNYIHAERSRLCPQKKIIGWHHTHPSYGIFLSTYDIFIHENFFNIAFEIAYVVDPIKGKRGFFGWKNGKIRKLNGYYIYD